MWSTTWDEVRRVIVDGVERMLSLAGESERRAAVEEVAARAEHVARGVVEYALKGVRAAEEVREQAQAALLEAERRHSEAGEQQRRTEWLISQRAGGARGRAAGGPPRGAARTARHRAPADRASSPPSAPSARAGRTACWRAEWPIAGCSSSRRGLRRRSESLRRASASAPRLSTGAGGRPCLRRALGGRAARVRRRGGRGPGRAASRRGPADGGRGRRSAAPRSGGRGEAELKLVGERLGVLSGESAPEPVPRRERRFGRARARSRSGRRWMRSS